MAEGFKIADAYVDIESRFDGAALRRSIREGIDDAEPDVRDHSRRRIGEPGGRSAATGFGDAFLNGITLGFRGGGSLSSAFSSSPWVTGIGLAIAGGVAAVAAPAIGAALSGIAIAGAGLGVIGLGAMLLKENPAVKAAATTLGNTVKSTFTDAAQVMVVPFVDSLGIFSKLVKDLGPDIKGMFADVAPAIKPLAEGLAGMVKESMPGFRDLVKASVPFLEGFAKALPGIGSALSSFMSSLAKGGPGALKFFQDIIVYVSNALRIWGAIFGWLAGAYGAIHNFFATQLPGAVRASVTWIQNAWNAIVSFFSRVGSAISSWASGAWNAVTGFFGRIGSAITGAASSIASGFMSVITWFRELPGRIVAGIQALPGMLSRAFTAAFNAVFYAIGFGIGATIRFFVTLPDRIRSALSSLVSTLVAIWTNVFDASVAWVTNTVTSVENWFRQLPGRASAAISTLWNALSTWFNQVVTSAVAWVSNLIIMVEQWFRQLPGRASSAISGLWGAISGWLTSAAASARNVASDLVNGFISWLQQLPGRAASAASGVRGAILGAFSGAGSWLYSAGMDIIRGVGNGISAMVGWAVGLARSAASSVVSGFKDALGISSPSRRMREEVGRQLLPGAMEGVTDTIPVFRRDVRDLTPDLTSAVAAAVTPARRQQGETVTYHFAAGAIVLDASKIKTLQDLLDMIKGLKSTARQYAISGVTR